MYPLWHCTVPGRKQEQLEAGSLPVAVNEGTNEDGHQPRNEQA